MLKLTIDAIKRGFHGPLPHSYSKLHFPWECPRCHTIYFLFDADTGLSEESTSGEDPPIEELFKFILDECESQHQSTHIRSINGGIPRVVGMEF